MFSLLIITSDKEKLINLKIEAGQQNHVLTKEISKPLEWSKLVDVTMYTYMMTNSLLIGPALH